MDNIFKRQIIFVMLTLFGCFYAKADDDLIAQQITVEVSEPGTLRNMIGSSKKNRITNLKLKGKLNVSDIQFIREMAGCYNENKEVTEGHLERLDMAEAEFVGSGSFSVYDVGGNRITAYFYKDRIDESCFSYLLNLKNIIIPSGVTSIGWSAFHGCSRLASVEIPSGVTSIGWSAFHGCSRLASVEIPSGVTRIDGYAFYGCSSLASVEIPSSVASIGEYAFWGCSSLASVEIPSSVTSIEDDVFRGCSSLVSVEIPSGVTSIGKSAFYGCSSLASVEIPSGVTSIGWSAFHGCSSLASVEIPSSVTSIENDVFRGCSSLVSVEIPSGVTSIGEGAFYDCSSLVSVYSYRKNPPALGSGAFGNLTFKNCILHIPAGSYQSYWLSNWGDFEHIVEFDPTGIENVKIQTNAMETSRYTLDGKRLNAPAGGVNIVKYNDGTVKKVVVK